MRSKIFLMLILIILVSLYARIANVNGNSGAVPTQTAQTFTGPLRQSPTAKSDICKVNTGIDGGTVNLRECGSTVCAVADIVTEGESLKILKADLWANVTTPDGVTGWLNSKYCKEDK
jgi:hypothetical protein